MKYPDEIKGDKLSKLVRKELGYKGPTIPKKRCITCKHSYRHNPGAYITGISCKLMDKKLKKVYPYDHTVVDELGVCKYHTN